MWFPILDLTLYFKSAANTIPRFNALQFLHSTKQSRLRCSIRLNSTDTPSQPQDGSSPITFTRPSGLRQRFAQTDADAIFEKLDQSNRDLIGEKKHWKNLQKRVRIFESLLKEGPYTIEKTWKIPNADRVVDGVKLDGDAVVVDGQKVPNIWLRDNCQCKNCVHGETRQRLLDTFSIPEDISIKSGAEFRTYIDITWSDGHHSAFDKKLLKNAAADDVKRAVVRQGHYESLRLWGSEVVTNLPKETFIENIKENSYDPLIHNVLRKIRTVGFCYISGVPATPEATENLLRRISFIRETHYGAFYDFTADLASKDTAYTNIALPAHTDTTYFSDPAGLQAFHLLSHTDGSGGESLLVDGFKAAETLLHEDPAAYHTLATVGVHAHASGNDGISIMPYKAFPVFSHDLSTGALLQVRWNVSDRSSIDLPLSDVEKWYAAARKFDAVLKRKDMEYWEQLKPGTVLVFDNWRVLHGRSEFTGRRRICGGYVNRDDWVSRFKMLHYGKEEVLGRLASG